MTNLMCWKCSSLDHKSQKRQFLFLVLEDTHQVSTHGRTAMECAMETIHLVRRETRNYIILYCYLITKLLTNLVSSFFKTPTLKAQCCINTQQSRLLGFAKSPLI